MRTHNVSNEIAQLLILQKVNQSTVHLILIPFIIFLLLPVCVIKLYEFNMVPMIVVS